MLEGYHFDFTFEWTKIKFGVSEGRLIPLGNKTIAKQRSPWSRVSMVCNTDLDQGEENPNFRKNRKHKQSCDPVLLASLCLFGLLFVGKKKVTFDL